MLVAGGLSAVLMLSVLVVVIFVGYRHGLDPDNVIGPVVTTLGDVFGVIFLLVGIRAVEVIL
jgi:mgtE-like transporter